jgi:hypothetical protein
VHHDSWPTATIEHQLPHVSAVVLRSIVTRPTRSEEGCWAGIGNALASAADEALREAQARMVHLTTTAVPLTALGAWLSERAKSQILWVKC